MSEFNYKEIDAEGWETLDVVAAAEAFNDWMYHTIQPFCYGKILEIGSGIGNISGFFLEDNFDITLSDVRSNYCDVLKQKFGVPDKVIQLDLTHPQFDTLYISHLEKYETVFALNVIEHIENDKLAAINCHKLLKDGGRLIVLVPAYQFLYNRFDKELEHYRRYTRKTLTSLFKLANFDIDISKYFNFMGIPGWYVSGKLQGNKTIPKGQMTLYNKLVPAFKIVDRMLLNKIGLSVISVGIKK